MEPDVYWYWFTYKSSHKTPFGEMGVCPYGANQMWDHGYDKNDPRVLNKVFFPVEDGEGEEPYRGVLIASSSLSGSQ